MKALKYMMILAAAPMLWACSADEGTEPGSDPNPVVTVYAYAPTEAGFNPDNDVTVRLVTNSKVTSVKYLALPTADITATLNNGGEKALVAKVESEGVKVDDLGGNSFADITLTDLHGEYTIAAVANGSSLGNRVSFLGLDWNTIKEGTFYLQNENIPIESTEAALEVCTSNSKLYRIKNAFGEGYSLKLDLLSVTGADEGGKFTLFSVKSHQTPWVMGAYGPVSVYDVGYWQKDESFVTNSGTGYANFLYEDGYVDVCLAWYMSQGVFSFGYSSFVPND